MTGENDSCCRYWHCVWRCGKLDRILVDSWFGTLFAIPEGILGEIHGHMEEICVITRLQMAVSGIHPDKQYMCQYRCPVLVCHCDQSLIEQWSVHAAWRTRTKRRKRRIRNRSKGGI